MKFINVGLENSIDSETIVVVAEPDSRFAKRSTSKAKEVGKLLDLTGGQKKKSVIIMKDGYVSLSKYNPETIKKRINEE